MKDQNVQKTRSIQKIVTSKPTIEGAGVHLKRAFGFNEPQAYDPFLLLDDFRSHNPEDYRKGFPWHPHRGIETITYVLKGEVEHKDSIGNTGVISTGAIQWMNSGSGILHQEMPRGDALGGMEGFQLWANLPSTKKMSTPGYQEVVAEDIPVVAFKNGVTARIICGSLEETFGPVTDVAIDPEYFDITVPPGTDFSMATKPENTVLVYIFEGVGEFGTETGIGDEGNPPIDRAPSKMHGNETLLLFGKGDQIVVRTQEKQVRFLFISGKPIGEPIAWHGPIVMNTRQELETAFEELDNGTFIKNN